jgi:hypothetical protein
MRSSRVKFCWWCGNKLQGNHYEIIEYEGYPRICHKWCVKALKEGREDNFVLRDDELLEEKTYNKALDAI